tara:strand:+ start:682 stop:912 length:231 start_codon:yes stop_codon:yes gene_type:complete
MKKRIEVYQTGDQFIAYDEQGNQIKDRNILEEISFVQPPGMVNNYYVDIMVDETVKPAIIDTVNININTQRNTDGI